MLRCRGLSRKLTALFTLLVMSLFTLGQSPVFAVTPTSDGAKERPFSSPAPESPSLRSFASLTFQDGNIGNANVQAKIGYDGRFNMGLKALEGYNWFNTIYAWPSSPGTSFTSLKVDGMDKVFGNTYDGQFLQNPHNINDTSNETLWKTGDISVKQIISAGLNPATGIDDAIQIKYVLTNAGTENHNIGLRIMLDTMVNGNDQAPFKVPTQQGMASINVERDFIGSEVPAFWQAFNDFNSPDISAQYTMSGRDATLPDRFTIANWSSIVGTQWDYNISPGRYTGDSAVGMWWNPVTLAPGETKTITTYYGRPGVGGSETLVLSGRQRIPYDEWSTSPFNMIAYLHNNMGRTLNNTELEIVPGPGIELTNDDPIHSIGNLTIGNTTQTTWSLMAKEPGIHSITVNAYEEGSNTPFATEQYQVETLEPIVPPNIALSGTNGIGSDGTPVSGRVTPLTVDASFNNPQAQSVTLIATDADGNRYEAEMTTDNGVDWTHSFVPSQKGLWESPMTIEIIPNYPDGSSGETLTFPIVLVDPSGFVYNAAQGEEWRLPGTTVRLQYFDPDLQAWVNMSEEAYSGRMSPITNPQITGSDGRYAWDVAAGQYRVIVSRDGFDTVISDSVNVPPPVTDLNIALRPNDNVQPTIVYSGVIENETYYQPVDIELTASDDLSGVRNITYSLDNGAETIVNGHSARVNVSSLGAHEINYTAVDYAGNATSGSVSFILEEEQHGFTVNVPGLNGIKAELVDPQTNEVVASSDWGDESVTVEDITGEFVLRITHNNPDYNVPITYTVSDTVNVTEGGEYTINPVEIVVPPLVVTEGIPTQVQAQVLYNNQPIDMPQILTTAEGGVLKELPLNSGKYQIIVKYDAITTVSDAIFTNGPTESTPKLAPTSSPLVFSALLGSPLSLQAGLLSPMTQTNTVATSVANGTAFFTVKAPGLYQIKADLLNPETNQVVASSNWGNESVTINATAGEYILRVTQNHPAYNNPRTYQVPDMVNVQDGGVATITPVSVQIPAMVSTQTTPRFFFGQVFYNGRAADINQFYLPMINGAFRELPLNDGQHYEVHLVFDPVLE